MVGGCVSSRKGHGGLMLRLGNEPRVDLGTLYASATQEGCRGAS